MNPLVDIVAWIFCVMLLCLPLLMLLLPAVEHPEPEPPEYETIADIFAAQNRQGEE